MTFFKHIEGGVNQGKKYLAILIDPDGYKSKDLGLTVDLANENDLDFFLIGGSLIMDDELDKTMRFLKSNTTKPLVLFPGNEIQMHSGADALLFLSLISGRNPEYLIGKHVVAAPKLKKMQLEVIPTGYALIHGSSPSTASYISNTRPIPYNKPEIAVATALASEMLGHKFLYLEGGSGTSIPVPSETITDIKTAINIPLFVGGGIRNIQKLEENYIAGADIQVIGTAFEQNPEMIRNFGQIKKNLNQQHSSV